MTDPGGETREHAATPLSFEIVYRTHAARIYRFCLSQMGNPSEAEDVAADVFVSAFAAYERTRPAPEAVAAWLTAIARNAVVDHNRRRDRWSLLWTRFLSVRSEADANADVEAAVLLRDDLRLVLAASARLRERDRLLVGLRIAANLSYAEVGGIMGLSEHAATVATRRALSRLRQMYEEGGP
ncbi:RNA polymerase sigma factor [Nonomuraea sp. NPDC050153]|uniref:RNA polymerase sigma factor n=1 Tax=Nonomuraea sp. NPDC050153 TaxID=3364359 RepID=UPI00378732D4